MVKNKSDRDLIMVGSVIVLVLIVGIVAAFNFDVLYITSDATRATNEAEYISQDIPTNMVAGQKYTVSITMKNTGKSNWTSANNYKLGSRNPKDNIIWGFGRVHLRSGNNIGSKQTKKFTFIVTAPSKPGSYDFQWQMLQESVTWFGDKTQNLKINVNYQYDYNNIDNEYRCKNNGGKWINNNCVYDKITDEQKCKNNGGKWINNNCVYDKITDEQKCKNNGGIWLTDHCEYKFTK